MKYNELGVFKKSESGKKCNTLENYGFTVH